MTERTELINDIEKLKAERNRLLRQVEEAEQWEGVAWDSFNSFSLFCVYLYAMRVCQSVR